MVFRSFGFQECESQAPKAAPVPDGPTTRRDPRKPPDTPPSRPQEKTKAPRALSIIEKAEGRKIRTEGRGAGKRDKQGRGEEIWVEWGAEESIRWTPARTFSAARISSKIILNELSGLPDKLSGLLDKLLRIPG